MEWIVHVGMILAIGYFLLMAVPTLDMVTALGIGLFIDVMISLLRKFMSRETPI